jgi:DNA-binding MarR family transcriptional regulator
MCICKFPSSAIEEEEFVEMNEVRQPDAVKVHRERASRCSCTALRKASRRVSQLYDVALAPCGLRTTQRAILNHIFRAGTPAIGELADGLVMDRGALAHNLKPLERDGFLEVMTDPRDRRNRLVSLTDAGRAKLAESEPLWALAQRRFEVAFGAAESGALLEALNFIVSDIFVHTFENAA